MKHIMTEEERRAAGRARSARYRAAHPDKVAAYRAANKASARRASAKYRAANPGKCLAGNRAYNEAKKHEKNAKGRAYHAANKQRIRAKRRAAYPSQRDDLLAKNESRRAPFNQGRRTRDAKTQEKLAGRPRPEQCEACGNKGNSKGIVFDHCHTAGHFRGWLCGSCNLALGLLKDDPSRLHQLIAYLDRTKDGTGAQLVISGI